MPAPSWPDCRWKRRWRWPTSRRRCEKGCWRSRRRPGLVVMQQMLTEVLASILGPKRAKVGAERVGNWHGTTTGQVVLGSQKVTVTRPRGRFVDGGEVELATWETFASEDLLRQVVVERMLAGVATRRHVDVTEPVGPIAGKATSKSAVSRRFKAATEAALADLLARDLTEVETAVLMIDGLNVADQMITVALIITADGTKVPAGLMLGDTENAVVVTTCSLIWSRVVCATSMASSPCS